MGLITLPAGSTDLQIKRAIPLQLSAQGLTQWRSLHGQLLSELGLVADLRVSGTGGVDKGENVECEGQVQSCGEPHSKGVGVRGGGINETEKEQAKCGKEQERKRRWTAVANQCSRLYGFNLVIWE